MVALMRSHLLDKVGPMASGTHRGGRPIDLSFGAENGRRPRRGPVCAAAGIGLAMLLAGGDLAAESLKIPYGMVPYSRPVYKNGKRILWHGAWRGGLGKYARQGTRAAEAKPALALAPEPQPAAAKKDFTVLADPGDARASRMARDFVDVLSADGAPGRVIVGSTSPNGLGKVLKAEMADFAIVSLDSLISSAKGDADWMKRSPFVARLAPETLAVIAPREVKSISDLQGKTVNFGDLDSATSISGRMLFSRLGVNATQTNAPLPDALSQLQAGKVAAVVVLGAEGSPALADFGADGRFHIVAIPWSPALEPIYTPAHVTAADRPNLVKPTEPVETVGEPMALVALDAGPGSQRADAIGRVARVFFDNYDAAPGRRSRPALARRQSRGRRRVAERTVAAARRGAKLAGREEVLGRWIAGGVSSLRQVGDQIGELAKRRRFGPALRRPDALARAHAVGETRLWPFPGTPSALCSPLSSPAC